MRHIAIQELRETRQRRRDVVGLWVTDRTRYSTNWDQPLAPVEVGHHGACHSSRPLVHWHDIHECLPPPLPPRARTLQCEKKKTETKHSLPSPPSLRYTLLFSSANQKKKKKKKKKKEKQKKRGRRGGNETETRPLSSIPTFAITPSALSNYLRHHRRALRWLKKKKRKNKNRRNKNRKKERKEINSQNKKKKLIPCLAALSVAQQRWHVNGG